MERTYKLNVDITLENGTDADAVKIVRDAIELAYQNGTEQTAVITGFSVERA